MKKLILILTFFAFYSCEEGPCKECRVVVDEGSPNQKTTYLGTMCGLDAEYIETYHTGNKNNGYPDVGYCD